MLCVFEPCSAVYSPVLQRVDPSSDETRQTVPRHRIGGHEWFGGCPASLMPLPLPVDYEARLRTQARNLYSLIRVRESMAAADAEHELSVQNNSEALGGAGRPPMVAADQWSGRDLDESGTYSTGSGGMATGGEFKASISAIEAGAEEIGQMLGACADRLDELTGMSSNTFAETQHTDTTVLIAAAVEKTREALTSMRAAMEAAATYRDGV